VNWAALAAFMLAKDPAFAASVEGVSREDVAELERGLSIALPRGYVDFLTSMGRDSDGFYPFTPLQTHEFDELLEDLPPRNYRADHLFKVSLASDPEEVSPLDYFLDLTRSDGDDAPLVMAGHDGTIRSDGILEIGLTFGEHITARLFTFLELHRRPENASVVVGGVERQQAQLRRNDAIQLLQRSKLTPALPPLPRVVCLTAPTLSALVSIDEYTRTLAIELGADDRSVLVAMVDGVLAGLPGATLLEPPHRMES
jgi:hypothetical protein